MEDNARNLSICEESPGWSQHLTNVWMTDQRFTVNNVSSVIKNLIFYFTEKCIILGNLREESESLHIHGQPSRMEYQIGVKVFKGTCFICL